MYLLGFWTHEQQFLIPMVEKVELEKEIVELGEEMLE